MPRCILYLGDLPFYSAPSAYTKQIKPLALLRERWYEAESAVSFGEGGKRELARLEKIKQQMVELVNSLPKPDPIAYDEQLDWKTNVLLVAWPERSQPVSWLLDISTACLTIEKDELFFPDTIDPEDEAGNWRLLCFDEQYSELLSLALGAKAPLWEADISHIGRLTITDGVRAVFGPRVWEVSPSDMQCQSYSAILGSLIRAAMHESEREAALAEIGSLGFVPRADEPVREHVPASVRDAVWHRDGGKCQECGAQADLEFDHVIPVSKGGSNSIENLRVLCLSCNRSKGSNVS